MTFLETVVVFGLLVALLAGSNRLLAPAASTGGRVARSGAQFFMVIGLSSITGIGYHLISPRGFLAGGGNTSPIETAVAATFLPVVEAENIRPLAERGAVLVDARLPQDYSEGHLPRAINIPVTMTATDAAKEMKSVSKDAHVVIYCQDRTCPFAHEVAKTLAAIGYARMSIFVGGWNAWRDYEVSTTNANGATVQRAN
jgi:rhodanese-related sulfurtransferase